MVRLPGGKRVLEPQEFCQVLAYEWATSRSCENKPILRHWRPSNRLGLEGCRELSSSSLKIGEKVYLWEKGMKRRIAPT